VKQYFGLWHALNQKKMPLPSMVRIAPLVVCRWNGSKGASDTITKLIDECDVKIPVGDSPQAAVISRVFMIVGVAIHRIMQAFSAKEDLDSYMMIERYRKSANSHITFRCTLDSMTQSLILKLNDKSSVPEGIPLLVSLATGVRARHSIESLSVDESFSSTEIGQASVLPDGGRIEKTKWSTCITWFTPKRRVTECCASPAKGKGADLAHNLYITKRRDECPGVPFAFHVCLFTLASRPPKIEVKFRGTCVVCSRQSNIYCYGCHHYMCGIDSNDPVPKKKEGAGHEQFFCTEVVVGTADGAAEKLVARYSC
jgi:hypothetical protein